MVMNPMGRIRKTKSPTKQTEEKINNECNKDFLGPGGQPKGKWRKNLEKCHRKQNKGQQQISWANYNISPTWISLKQGHLRQGSPTTLPCGVRSCEVAIIWPEIRNQINKKKD